MPNIETILDNITEYRNDIESLVKQLRELGINSLQDLKDEAKEMGVAVPADIQNAVEAKFLNTDDDDWTTAKAENTVESYQKYLSEHQDGKYRADARNAISALNRAKEAEATAGIWDGVDKNSIDALQSFINEHPDDPHTNEASKLLRDLRKEKYIGVDIKALAKQMKDIRTNKNINNPELAIYEKIKLYISTGKISKADLLGAIRDDHNFISSTVANLLWENGIIDDFSQADIDPDFITYMMSNKQTVAFQAPEPLEKVTKVPCTEVYFWGIPSSGKSCALGAILSAAKSGKYALSMQMHPDCQGYGYMNRLANLFKSNSQVGTLPEGTPTTSTYEMGFDLEDSEKKVHPLTCIDLAGELVRCMYKNDANESLTDQEKEVLQTLTRVMVDNRTKNRKIHFFVIEYGAEDREYEGLPQGTYLEAAVAYIQRTGIFKKDTDGLYLLISKVDKANAKGKELNAKLQEYIQGNYQGFYNGLKKICRDNEINGGNVDIMPFTLGDVCFQNFCKFKDKTASMVVNKLIERSYGYKVSKFNKMLNKLTE